MKIRLACTLHARPASALGRLVGRFASRVVLRKDALEARGNNVLELLALGAAGGDILDVEADGADADEALVAIQRLVESCFAEDLVPEMAHPAVAGIASGTAVVFRPPSRERPRMPTSARDECQRTAMAFGHAEDEVVALASHLPPDEASLFAPEVEILHNLRASVLRRVEGGASTEAAIELETQVAYSDLVVDAKTRLLDALEGIDALSIMQSVATGARGSIVLVTENLTPSLVAMLPETVVGIVAIASPHDAGGFTAHAAILARSRSLPLVYVPSRIGQSIVGGQTLVLDATTQPARLWLSPSETLIAELNLRRDEAKNAERAEMLGASLVAPLPIALRANIGSLKESVPAGADGIGLVRTELLYVGRSKAPSESEQLAAILSLAKAARGRPVFVRLFDAGGDKPLPWLADRRARGIELLRLYPEILNTQVRAIRRARAHADVRILVPLARSSDDVAVVRSLAGADIPIGAMVETVSAVEQIDTIADVADSISVGTNDLAASVLGIERGDVSMGADTGLLRLIDRTIARAHAKKLHVTICGEIAGDSGTAKLLVGLGVDALSVNPSRVEPLSAALSGVSRESCRSEALAALGRTASP